jgi:ribosomal protein S3AE
MAQEKKKFFEVEIPTLRTKIKLIAYQIEQLDNRNVKLDLTRLLRGQSMEALINVKIKDGKATGNLRRIAALGFYIRRMMRTSISYVEDSFSAECLDSILRIKPFLITRKKVTRAVRKALRNEAKRFITEEIKNKSTEEIFADIISMKFQRTLSFKLKKIYPLALCEIRQIFIEKDKAPILAKVEEEKKEQSAE